MDAAALDKDSPVTAEQKRAALDAALKSHTFARADQLKSFLRYVCEMEIEGRGNELTEYLIGVEALGRPSKYSPGDDSAVRNRAFALRKKLQEYHEHENPDAPIHIELHKGSYCPHFIASSPPEKSNGHEVSTYQSPAPLIPTSPAPELPALPASELDRKEKRSLRGFMAGVVVAALVAGAIYLLTGLLTGARRATDSTASGMAPILAEAWGPILTPQAEVLVCVANPPSLSVHTAVSPLPASTPSLTTFNDPGGRPMPKELLEWYKQKYPAPDNYNHHLTVTTNAAYWGDAIGAMTALRTLTHAGIVPQMFPEKVVAIPTLRRRNVILFGTPQYSPAIAHFLEKCPLTVKYLDAIISRDPGSRAASPYTTKRDEKNRVVRVYGLITVLPSESSTEHRTVIFSGVNSAGAQAAAEFFSSPQNLTELRNRLGREAGRGFPPAYQVVVRAETDDSILLSFKYETHRLLPD